MLRVSVYISITIVKKTVPENIMSLLLSVRIVTSAQKYHSFFGRWQEMSDIFSGIAWYYGDNDFII